MRELRTVLNERKEEYLTYLKELIEIDTHDIGHGIEGGLEKEGQEYIIRLFEKMNADSIEKDYLTEQKVQECMKIHHEGNQGIIMKKDIMFMQLFMGKEERVFCLMDIWTRCLRETSASGTGHPIKLS